MALFTLPKNTVVKVANSTGSFRIENRDLNFVNIKYSSTLPTVADTDWASLTDKELETSLGLGLDLYAYSEFGGELVVFATNPVV